MYLLSTGSNKTLQLSSLNQKLNDPAQKKVAIGRYVEQINAIEVVYIMDGVWKRSPQSRHVPRNSQWGLFWESRGGAPSRRKHGDMGAEPPALKNFPFFFAKITKFYSYFNKK